MMSKVGQAALGIIVVIGMTAVFCRIGITILDRPEVYFMYHGQDEPSTDDLAAVRVEGKWVSNPKEWFEKNTRPYEMVWCSPEWRPLIPADEHFPVATAIAR
jgi:hypothetical protein